MNRLVRLITIAVFCAAVATGCAATTGRTAGETVDDSVITSEVNGKIIKDPDLHFLKINVDTFEGNVTLTGKVPSREAEDRLVRLAKQVKGVKSVKTNLTVEQKSP